LKEDYKNALRFRIFFTRFTVVGAIKCIGNLCFHFSFSVIEASNG
jgi:hypothetical protein